MRVKRTVVLIVPVVVVFFIAWYTWDAERKDPAKSTDSELAVAHIHGMGYTPEGLLAFAAHSGLRVYDGKRWTVPPGERHDYMGFTMTDDGFYASGHPAPGSKLQNPLGLVKSSDLGQTLDMLDLYGEVDFHVLTAGYRSHRIYVYHSEPNRRLPSVGLYVSADEGKTWQKRAMKGLGGKVLFLAAHPENDRVVAAATEEGAFVSFDDGETFQPLRVSGTVTALAFDLEGRLWLGVYGQEAALITIDVKTGTSAPMPLPSLGDDPVQWISVHPATDHAFAIATARRYLYVTDDGGKRWEAVMKEGYPLR
ncbi:MAG: glycosyl hydrolase [Hydrogenibacillus sp.]|nr:glycosyl hydrolase [Hydrogenibacillus sp.]